MTEPQTPTSEPFLVVARRPRPILPITLLLLVAIATTAIVVLVARGGPTDTSGIGKGKAVPNVAGTTLTGKTFDLASLRGKPVLINFWGPGCVPCREEFPLLAAKAVEHQASGLVIVGVLTDDPVEPARAFAAQYGGTWETVIDPGAAIKAAYHVIARPQTYFVDRNGVLQSIQPGQLTDADFERQFAQIAGGG
ncbi:MAG TPA: TlpA disulfide reductase family protein [Candidatus Limnocylindrales bacterium]|nr:TlpA disulfide reductase family protein [Candidatus Limnocylindrales bacterium]